jgi:hypothetical protein
MIGNKLLQEQVPRRTMCRGETFVAQIDEPRLTNLDVGRPQLRY